ncbi:hypothetical protein TNCV_2295991 [Trichonephila clavipes]|nr:hypothetical protein TNCV_2295991 [Trichonephila clavipes]
MVHVKEGLIGSSYVCPKCGKSMELRERTEQDEAPIVAEALGPIGPRLKSSLPASDLQWLHDSAEITLTVRIREHDHLANQAT